MNIPEINEQIEIPEGVTVTFENDTMIIKGEKGELTRVFSHPKINIKMNGKVDSAKYTYNSGQMLQAAALLYKLTGEKNYLSEAQKIAKSAILHFTKDFTTPEGKQIRLFKNTGNWFNTILFRGYAELYRLDKNPEYIQIFQDNLDQLWNHVRDKNGLFGKDWTGKDKPKYQWLLDQASLVELWATMAELNDSK